MSRYQDTLGIFRPNNSLVYYNALTVNNGTGPLKAEFNSVESGSIVDRPRDYRLSVLRFYLSARNLLPIFWWQQTEDLTLPQQFGKYIVSMSYGGSVVSEHLVFKSLLNGGAPPPNTDRNLTAVNAPYWGVYSHSYFVDIINAGLKSVYSRLSGLQPLAPPVVQGCIAPFLDFSKGSGLISLVAGRPFNQLFANGETIKVWFNAELYTFFSESLQYADAYRPGTNPLGVPLDFQIEIEDTGRSTPAPQQRFITVSNPTWISSASYVINQLVEYNGFNYRSLGPSTGLVPPLNPGSWQLQTNEAPPDYSFGAVYGLGDRVLYGGGYYRSLVAGNTGNIPGPGTAFWELDPSLICFTTTQDYPSTYRWIAVQRYLLLASGLSNVPEFTPAANGGFNQTSQPFLIDFTPDYSAGGDAAGTGEGNVLYTPSAEFKRIELQGDTPIKAINLSVYVMTNTGIIIPVYLGPQGSFSCKLLFERI
jgi:hypothetical protein